MYDATPQRTHWGPRDNSGFSLVEMLMVLSIMAILGAIASPKIVSGRQAAQRRAATNQFVSAHRLTRATALRYGRRTEFHVDATGLRFWIVVDTGQTAGTPDTVRMVSLAGTELTMASNRTILCFDARGLPTTAGACEAADALVTFAETGKIDTVRFTALGQELR